MNMTGGTGMSRRLIDADALKIDIEQLAEWKLINHRALISVVEKINAQPTVDAEPVKRGEWRKTYLDHEAFGERPSIFYCSACCACSNVKTKYCPQCGARMDEDDR